MLVPFIQILQNIFLLVSDYWKFIAVGGESVVTLLRGRRVGGLCYRVCEGVMIWKRVTWIFDNFVSMSCPKALKWHWLMWSFKLLFVNLCCILHLKPGQGQFIFSGPKFKDQTPQIFLFGAFVFAPYEWSHNNFGNFCKVSRLPWFVTMNYFSCSFPNKYKHSYVYFENCVNNTVGWLLQRFFIPCSMWLLDSLSYAAFPLVHMFRFLNSIIFYLC